MAPALHADGPAKGCCQQDAFQQKRIILFVHIFIFKDLFRKGMQIVLEMTISHS